MLELRFLGTGPSGGRPGRGRDRRRESSLLVVAGGGRVLVDATRDFDEQAAALGGVDLVLLTHGHRDASGGVGRLDRWLAGRGAAPVDVLGSAATVRTVAGRHRGLRACRLVAVAPGRRRRWRGLVLSALEVPHSRDAVTFAWKLAAGGRTLVYASDVARLEPRLRRFAAGADLLVLDGAMWRRSIFSHLRLDEVAPVVARWPVGRVLFTQLGRGTPAHALLERWLGERSPRLGAAHDGLRVRVG